MGAKGPVVVSPDPIVLNDMYHKKAHGHAVTVKTLIDTKGYYSKTLNASAGRLASETGHTNEEIKTLITSIFETEYSVSPYEHLQNQRKQQNLPIRESNSQKHSQEQEQ